MTFIVIVVLASLVGAFLMRNRIATLTGLSADTITRVCIMLFFCLILFTGRSCASDTTGGAGSALPISTGGLVFLLIILLTSAGWKLQAQPNNIVLPLCLVLMAAVVLIAILGELDSLFRWAVGILIVIGLGFWTANKTTGNAKTFLEFASSTLAVIWIYLLYLTFFSDTEFEFMDILFPDKMSEALFVVFLAFFIFAAFMNSKLWRLVSIFILLSVLGSSQPNTGRTVFGEIIGRYPKQLTLPPMSQETKNTVNNVWSSLLRSINKAVAPTPPTPNRAPVPQTKAPASSPSYAPASPPVPVAKSVAPQSVAQPTNREVWELTIRDQSIPVTLFGKWKVEPTCTEYQETGGRKTPSNGTLGVAGAEKYFILTIPGNQPGTYRQGRIKLTRIG